MKPIDDDRPEDDMTTDTQRPGERVDTVEHLLARSLDRFGKERRKRQARMEETVRKFALRLFEEESRLSEAAAESPAGQDQTHGIEAGGKPSGSETILVALDGELVRRLRTVAEERQAPVSSLVESAVSDWLEGYERMKRRRQQLRGPR